MISNACCDYTKPSRLALIWQNFPNFTHSTTCFHGLHKMQCSSRRCVTSHLESCRVNVQGKTLHTHSIDRTYVKPAKGVLSWSQALLPLLLLLLVQHTPLCVLYTCFQCWSAPRHLSLTSKTREPGSLPHDVHFSLLIWSTFNKYQMGQNVPCFSGHMLFFHSFSQLILIRALVFLSHCWEDIWPNRQRPSTKRSCWLTCIGEPLLCKPRWSQKNMQVRHPPVTRLCSICFYSIAFQWLKTLFSCRGYTSADSFWAPDKQRFFWERSLWFWLGFFCCSVFFNGRLTVFALWHGVTTLQNAWLLNYVTLQEHIFEHSNMMCTHIFFAE